MSCLWLFPDMDSVILDTVPLPLLVSVSCLRKGRIHLNISASIVQIMKGSSVSSKRGLRCFEMEGRPAPPPPTPESRWRSPDREAGSSSPGLGFRSRRQPRGRKGDRISEIQPAGSPCTHRHPEPFYLPTGRLFGPHFPFPAGRLLRPSYLP